MTLVAPPICSNPKPDYRMGKNPFPVQLNNNNKGKKKKKKRKKRKSKAIPVTGLGDIQGCEMLRIPHCLDNRLTDGSKVVSPMHRPRSTPQKHYYFCFWYSFLLEAE
jgi:hypothetical protein